MRGKQARKSSEDAQAAGYQSVTFRFRNFQVSKLFHFLDGFGFGIKKFGIEKSIGFSIRKIWYRKKFRIRYCSDFGYRHTLLQALPVTNIKYQNFENMTSSVMPKDGRSLFLVCDPDSQIIFEYMIYNCFLKPKTPLRALIVSIKLNMKMVHLYICRIGTILQSGSLSQATSLLALL